MAALSTEFMTSDLVVCLKWVPLRAEIDPLSGTVVTDNRFSGLSPADQAALEWALRVAEERDLTIGAMTVGGPEAEAGLRQALAAGAANAIRIGTPDDEGDGTELPSRAVAAGLAPFCQSASLVFCGDHSLDRGSGSVPAFLASHLSFGQALGCIKLGIDQAAPSGRTVELTAERRLDQGRRERLAITGKTVLSFEGGLELRRAPLRATLAGSEREIPVVNLDPGVDSEHSGQPGSVSVAATGPFRPRPRVLPGPEGATMARIRQLTGVGDDHQASQQLELAPNEAADVVVEQLTTWGYLDTTGEKGSDAGA